MVVDSHVVTLVYKDPEQAKPTGGAEQAVEFKLPPCARDGSIRFTVREGGSDKGDFVFESRR